MDDEPVNPADDLQMLLSRLKASQRNLLLGVARQGIMPSDGTLRKVGDLENTIAAVEALIEEERQSTRLKPVA
jgi:hypothetical protein